MMAISMVQPASPPRAPVAFRVGIVGHRPNRLPPDKVSLDTISGLMAQVLSHIRDAVGAFAVAHPQIYAPGTPRLFAISPLADGSDRLFASAALDLGYGLCVPMPFPQAEYEKDFGAPADDAATGFHALLDRAEKTTSLARFELDGTRADEGEAYGAAGRVVLNQSDLLVVVWDGEAAEGKGGTVDTLKEAIEYHMPVIWIDARKPFGWTLLRQFPEPGHAARGTGDLATLADTLRALVQEELEIPVDRSQPPLHGDQDQRDSNALAGVYFGERRPPINWHFGWKMFRNLFGGGGSIIPRFRTRDFVEETRAQNDGPDDEELITHFAWADKLADLYADAHRGGVIATSILSASAVILGLTPIVLGIEDGNLPWVELGIISFELLILYLLARTISQAKHKHFHDKWLEYRMLAEWIRQLRIMAPLGGGRPLLRTRAHLSVYGEPLRSWMYWHVRAITRARALPSATADRQQIARYLDGIGKTIDGQIAFHAATMERSNRIQHRLHLFTKWIVRVTIAAVMLHFVIKGVGIAMAHWNRSIQLGSMSQWVFGTLLICSAFLPAASASIANINNQGEFVRLGKRARAMRDSFLRLKPEADAMRRHVIDGTAPVGMTHVTNLASRMAATMLEEVVDWRVVVLDLPQGLE
jgi:hypothetical protein